MLWFLLVAGSDPITGTGPLSFDEHVSRKKLGDASPFVTGAAVAADYDGEEQAFTKVAQHQCLALLPPSLLLVCSHMQRCDLACRLFSFGRHFHDPVWQLKTL